VNRRRTVQLLNRYDVTDIYVGDPQRALCPEAGWQKLDAAVGSDPDLVRDRAG
jgi:hypothetical protein